MDALFEIIRNQLERHRVTTYHMEPLLITANHGKKTTIDINNDFYFFVNAFSDSGTLNGRILGVGGGNALDISPLTANMKAYKYQMFKGRLVLQNFDPINTLFVEVLRITPIPDKKTACEGDQNHS